MIVAPFDDDVVLEHNLDLDGTPDISVLVTYLDAMQCDRLADSPDNMGEFPSDLNSVVPFLGDEEPIINKYINTYEIAYENSKENMIETDNDGSCFLVSQDSETMSQPDDYSMPLSPLRFFDEVDHKDIKPTIIPPFCMDSPDSGCFFGCSPFHHECNSSEPESILMGDSDPFLTSVSDCKLFRDVSPVVRNREVMWGCYDSAISSTHKPDMDLELPVSSPIKVESCSNSNTMPNRTPQYNLIAEHSYFRLEELPKPEEPKTRHKPEPPRIKMEIKEEPESEPESDSSENSMNSCDMDMENVNSLELESKTCTIRLVTRSTGNKDYKLILSNSFTKTVSDEGYGYRSHSPEIPVPYRKIKRERMDNQRENVPPLKLRRTAPMTQSVKRVKTTLRRTYNRRRNAKSKRGRRPTKSSWGSRSSSDNELHPVKRSMHNNMERMRRLQQRKDLDNLRTEIPQLKDDPKSPKVKVLHEARVYVHHLRDMCKRNDRERKEEQQKCLRLTKQMMAMCKRILNM